MLEALLDALPPHANDVRRTLTAALEDPTLSEPHKWGCVVTAAETLASPALLREADRAPEDIATAARGVAAVMAMNNVYFRAVHLMKSADYAKMRAGIRMHALNIDDKIAADLWSITASAINACGACLDEHEEKLRANGGTAEQAHAALRLAAALAGAAAVLRD
jgi:alkyl hydroperoxide reductase subunit D